MLQSHYIENLIEVYHKNKKNKVLNYINLENISID
jgi:hypothetical protein